MSLVAAGSRISEHTFRRSSREKVRVLEAGQVKNDGSITALVLAHGN